MKAVLTLAVLAAAAISLLVLWPGREPGGFDPSVSKPSPAEARKAPPLTARPVLEQMGSSSAARSEAVPSEVSSSSVADSESLPVVGRVVDHRGEPIAEAEIVAQAGGASGRAGDSPAPRLETRSDASGRFELGLRVGRHGLRARHPGYEPGVLEWIEVPGRSVVLRLRAWASVRGRVIDARTQEPIDEAAIGIRSERRRQGGRPGADPTSLEPLSTDADGSFALEMLPAGEHVLEARHPDYGTERVELTLAPGEVREVFLTLARGLDLRGVVLDERGAPVGGCRVQAHVGRIARGLVAIAEEPPRGSGARTDTDGRFEIGSLPPGEYRLSVDAEGFRPLVDGPHLLEFRDLDVEIHLHRGITLHGVVYDSEGEPWPEAAIMGIEVEGQQPVAGAADERGHYEIAGLAPGEYVFFWGEAEGDPSRALTDPFSVGVDEAPNRQEVDLRRVASGSVTLWGKVIGPDGLLDSGAVQFLRNTRGLSPLTSAQNADIATDGGYRLEGLVGGPGLLLVLGLDRAGLGAPVYFHVELPREGEMRFDVELPEAHLTGGFVGEDLTGGTVELGLAPVGTDRPLDGLLAPRASASVGSDGRFDLGPMPPAEYTLFARLEWRSGGASFWTRRAVVVPGDLGEIAVVGRGATLRLQVEDEAGRPASGAVASIVTDSLEHWPRETARRSDESGRIEIAGLPPGRYQVVVSAPGRAPVRVDVQVSGGQVIERRARLEASHRLELQVVDGSGEPVENARVDLLASDGSPLPLPFHLGNVEEAWRGGGEITDAEGRATVDTLAAGRYRLRLECQGEDHEQAIVIDRDPTVETIVFE